VVSGRGRHAAVGDGIWSGRLRSAVARGGLSVALLVLPVAFPQTLGAFSDSTANGAKDFAAAVSFPTYPAAVGGDGPQFYHRAEDAATASGTGNAADSSGNNRTGTFDGGSDGPRTWWRFNDGSGTTEADARTVNPGTLTNGPAWGGAAAPTGKALWFDGVDDVRANPRAMTATEVAALYATPNVQWDFDDGSHANAWDRSGNGNTGSLSGADWDASNMRSSTHSLQFDGSGTYVTASKARWSRARGTPSPPGFT
jgi:hypothetical protein